MLTTEGEFWRKWRSIFNPGFSIQQVVSQVSMYVTLISTFYSHSIFISRVMLTAYQTTKITIDVIGKVVCDHDFRTLSGDNEFMTTMRKTLGWMPNQQSINPFHLYHPLRPIFWKYYKSKMDRYIGKVLDERFAVRDARLSKRSRQKTGIDLALEEYVKENGQNAGAQDLTMDTEFRKAAIDNLLVLLFAGHDTTASTLCYCYHLLQQNPHELAKVRQELDEIFGIGKSAGEQLKSNPYLVNQLEYTLAVIKEVLRLWPPASTVRIGCKGFFIKDPVSGDMIDTDGMLIWSVHMAIHRDKRIWGDDVDEFKPERFLPKNADKVPADAWRPFEKGLRNCIGQELALIEMKVVLSMTLREFDIRSAYGELDSLMGDGSLWAKDSSFRKGGSMEVFGDRMHQILLAAGKPSEAFGTVVVGQNTTLDLKWYAPKKSWINDLGQVLNGTGTNGFVFNSSQLPAGTSYGSYNWCNMPHVRAQEYPKVGEGFELVYVEVPIGNESAKTYWSVYTNDVNPFSQSGFKGSCQFPQITREGLDDSWQHGKDLFGVYHDLLGFLPDDMTEKVSYRVTNNQITSQVAGMVVNGMYGPDNSAPLRIQPTAVDSLEPQYSCPKASSLYSSYGVGSTESKWTAHLTAAKSLFNSLDTISGIPIDSTDWHKSFDHYYDNLSARQCHAKPLPCNINDKNACVTQKQADTVYRLGQHEYSFIHRDSPQSLQAAVGSYGVFLAELAQNIRDASSGKSPIIYRHNVAHDGSVSRLLSILQVEQMVWVGMGSEVVFEIYSKSGYGDDGKKYIRILWGGQVLKSSSPTLGEVDMLDLDVFLGYLDGLVGQKAANVVAFCKL
ncbi:cytochrome P450 [Phaeosphaeriaceae sp. PMI808]|nr:cytochrome P450 [Phaeosphaeriaceae sp. PMI808]